MQLDWLFALMHKPERPDASSVFSASSRLSENADDFERASAASEQRRKSASKPCLGSNKARQEMAVRTSNKDAAASMDIAKPDF